MIFFLNKIYKPFKIFLHDHNELKNNKNENLKEYDFTLFNILLVGEPISTFARFSKFGWFSFIKTNS